MEYVALGSIVFVSIVLPIIISICVIWKDRKNIFRDVICFITGILVYIVTQWGLFEHGLQGLTNYSKESMVMMLRFMTNHYFIYMILVSLVCSVLLFGVSFLLAKFLVKGNYTLKNIFLYGLGYCGCEATLLVGIKSFRTIFEFIKGTEGALSTSVPELFLSAYERVLIGMIKIMLIFVLAYFIKKGKGMMGFLISLFGGILLNFLPAFFIAFSETQFYEIYSRNVALTIVYVLLTAAAVTAFVVMSNLAPAFLEDNCTKKNSK